MAPTDDGPDSLPVDPALLRAIFESMPEAYMRADMQGRFVLVNPSAARLYRYDSPSEMIGLSVDELYAEPGVRAGLLERLRSRDRIVDFVALSRCKDGSTFWASLNAQVVRDASGSMIGTEGYVRDVTERKAAGEALRRSEARFQKAFEHSPDAIALNRMKDGLYIDVNQGFLELTGYERNDLIGRTSLEMSIWVDPADRDRLVRGLRDSGEVVNLEAWFRGKGDRQVLALMSAGVIDLEGEPHILSVTRDISELRRVAAENAELESRLRQVEKMESVGRLAGGVAHDFNNMLGVILGHTELALKDTDPSHSTYADLLAIQQAARRSADLTRQLLAFARKQTIARQVVDLNLLVQDGLKMLRRLIGEGVSLRWNPSPDAVPVNVDPAQMDQVLTNLCANARDAMSGTGVLTIETRVRKVDESERASLHAPTAGPYVALRVQDTGVGMAPETLVRAFEPYFTTKEQGKGTGLGLATVYGIVQQNGGFVEVDSQLGHGTTLTVHLPLHLSPAVETGSSAGEEEPFEPVADAGQETLLLVEDEPAILALAARMLELKGYVVLRAATPEDALRLAAQHRGGVHLLITDVIMPGMNGRELAAQLRSAWPNLKCLYMSGYTADVIARHGVLDAGVHFVQKPFSVADLATKVREALDE